MWGYIYITENFYISKFVTDNQLCNNSFDKRLESIQYNAELAIAGVIRKKLPSQHLPAQS